MMSEALAGKRVLVTGVTGMMGQAVARHLARHNTVYGAARFSDDAARQRLENEGVHCVALDLSDPALRGLPEGIDTLLHFAVAWPGGMDLASAMQINGYAVGRLLARLEAIERFIISSTVAVYTGSGNRHDLTEDSPTIPGGAYGTSKLAGDVLATHFAQTQQVPGAILRYWFPYTNDRHVKHDYFQGLLAKLRNGETFVLPRGGGCEQPLFIDDVVEITLKSLGFANTEPFVLNVAGPERLSLQEVVETMGTVFGIEPKIELSEAGESSLLSGSFDLRKLEQTCGMGRVRFREGLERLKAAMEQTAL